ncbi:MAG: alpha-amylase family glycosyl hydrolase [Candidatus Andersenbacteria bacterium]
MHVSDKWARTAVVYQVYPRSFKDSNGDGIGDLAGIIEKLDYLNNGTDESLGVNAIWLNPIYVSPQKDFGYDVSNHCDIDPMYGDLATFDKLVLEAHKRGIKIIMDFVPNHTSEEHPWFIESRSSLTNPKRDWYIWRNGEGDGQPPNNWISVFNGSAWTLDPITNQYYMHSFLSSQPDLNWRNIEVRSQMLNILRFWQKRGVDGFRADAIYHIVKDSEFKDDLINPAYIPGKSDSYEMLLHTHSIWQNEMFETTNNFCEVLGEEGDLFLLSEAYLGVADMQKLYHSCGEGLHAPFNFNFITLPWDAMEYKKFTDEFELSLRKDDVPTYVLGNHDRSRVAERWGDARARLGAILIFTLRGMPFIYYGDELGMKDTEVPPDKVVDPCAKNVVGTNVGRDPERTPMQWDVSEHAGFTTGEPWLPVSKEYPYVNVEAQRKDPASMFNLYRHLIRTRKNSSAILRGRYVPVDSRNKNVFAYIREYEQERMLIAVNFSEELQTVSFDFGVGQWEINSLLDHADLEHVNLESLLLRPLEGAVFKLP